MLHIIVRHSQLATLFHSFLRMKEQLSESNVLIIVAHYHLYESQRGGGMLDAKFSYGKAKTRSFVNAGNDVSSHAEIFDPLK